ncbi:hypothetical protein [Rivularia sp. UHCC 0363]|uniref:hypothetical protein n=1 Tax=Rivularia sp. UHCC 0363 TaxID=3110244 RepID=UPI002B200571|nr:hypothetical protein [Rivularia sp. UHCC 0363]MEA5596282.1 hypothetical protein [Rivularia sp. UHCC 0363]
MRRCYALCFQPNVKAQKLYRFIKKVHETPQPQDFLSWGQENPNKECPTSISECQACGVSIHSSLDDAKNLSLRIPRFKKMKIAKGSLSEELGRIQHTPSKNEKSHHTWWIPENTEPYKVFELIDLKQEDSNKT